MPSISNEFTDWQKLIIVLDNESSGASEQRMALREGLFYCYPGGELIKGFFFDQFIVDEHVDRNAKCTPVELTLQTEDDSRLAWNLSTGKASSLTLSCDRHRQNFEWIEAEEISIGPGWQIQINFAPGWLGSGFLMDTYGSQFLGYEFNSRFTKREVFVWVRTYKRVTDNSPAFINVNDTTQVFGKTEVTLLNRWRWERLGPFPNEKTIRITIARPYNEAPGKFMALFMDTFVFTDDPFFSPEVDLTEPITPLHFTLPSATSLGAFQPDLPSGEYTCHIQIDSEGNLVDNFGRIPVLSKPVELSIP